MICIELNVDLFQPNLVDLLEVIPWCKYGIIAGGFLRRSYEGQDFKSIQNIDLFVRESDLHKMPVKITTDRH